MIFFGGSGTTSQAVLEINKEDNGNRKFILVQLPELTEIEGNEHRATSTASKLGFKTISEISKERIKRVIYKIRNENSDLFNNGELDLGVKVFKLSSSNFKIWRGNEISEENLVQQLDAFTNPISEGSQEEKHVV